MEYHKSIRKLWIDLKEKNSVYIVGTDKTIRNMKVKTQEDIERLNNDPKVLFILSSPPTTSSFDRLVKKSKMRCSKLVLQDYENVWTFSNGKYRYF